MFQWPSPERVTLKFYEGDSSLPAPLSPFLNISGDAGYPLKKKNNMQKSATVITLIILQ